MNKKIVRFSSLLLALLMVLSLCACGEEEETYDYKSPIPTTTEEILTTQWQTLKKATPASAIA